MRALMNALWAFVMVWMVQILDSKLFAQLEKIPNPAPREASFDLIRLYRNNTATAQFKWYKRQSAWRLSLGVGYNRSENNPVFESNLANADKMPEDYFVTSYNSFNSIALGWQKNTALSDRFWWYYGADLAIGASFWKSEQNFFGTRFNNSDSTFYISSANISYSRNTILSLGANAVLGTTYIIGKHFSITMEVNSGSTFFPMLGASRYIDMDYKKTYNWSIPNQAFESQEPTIETTERNQTIGFSFRPAARVELGFFF